MVQIIDKIEIPLKIIVKLSFWSALKLRIAGLANLFSKQIDDNTVEIKGDKE
jgi:hypothetical protein